MTVIIRAARIAVVALPLATGSAWAAEIAGSDADTSAPMEYRPPRITLDEQALRRAQFGNSEGLVKIMVDVSAEGVISNAQLIKGGFGGKSAGPEMLKVVEKSRSEPALENGVPVAVKGFVTTAPIRSTTARPGNLRPLQRHLDSALEMIAAEDPTARTVIEEMMWADVRTFSDYVYINVQLAMAYRAAGRPHDALLAAREAFARGRPRGILGPGESNTPLPQEFGLFYMDLAASLGSLAEALETYELLERDAPKSLPPGAASNAAGWRAAMRSPVPVTAHVELTELGEWSHRIYGQRFAVQNIRGRVASVRAVCGRYGSWQLPPESESWFEVPAAALGNLTDSNRPGLASSCLLTITGEAGTRLDIVEQMTGAKSAASP